MQHYLLKENILLNKELIKTRYQLFASVMINVFIVLELIWTLF